MSSSRSQARDLVPPLTPASRTRSRRLAQESPKAPLTIPAVQDSPTRSTRSTRAHDQLERRNSSARDQDCNNGVNIREETLDGSKSRRVASPQRQSRLIVSIPLSDPPKRGREQDDQGNAEPGQKHSRLLDGSKKTPKEPDASILEEDQPLAEPIESLRLLQSNKDGMSTRSSGRSRSQRHQSDTQERHGSQRQQEPDPLVLEKENGQEDMEIVPPIHLELQDNTADEAGDMHPADRDRSEPPSQDEGDEEVFERVPEYIKREMQEFEQGFNGLEGKFKLLDKIGEGTFSSVYKAVDLEHDEYSNSHWDYGMDEQPRPISQEDKESAEEKKAGGAETGKVVAIKRIYVTSSPKRIENEIRILHELSGHKNVVPLVTAFRYRDQVIVVLPYFEHKDFRSYYRTLPMDDIRCYLRALLKALAHVHSHKIIHRDVKPSNFLYDLEKRTGVLVDFGLAHKQKESASATVSSTSKSASRAQNIKPSKAASVTTTGTEAGASSSNVSTTAPLEQLATRQAQGHSNKENIEPTPPRNRAELAPMTGVNQPNTLTERTTVLEEEGLTSSNQSARPRTVFVPNATTTQALQAMPAAQTPSLVNHVRPNPLHAPPSMLPFAPAIPQTSIIATNREPGFLKKDNRPSLRVNRAGTRGFRAPEILFRHVRQTVALDIWSVGVILISILSGRFPFFNSADDAEAILEIGVLFGNREMKNVAAKFNRSFDTNVPSIKELPILLLRIVRLLYPKRFGPPDGYVSKLYPPKPRPQGRPERQPSASSFQPPPQQLPASAQGTAAAISQSGGSNCAPLKISQQPPRLQKPKRLFDGEPLLLAEEKDAAEQVKGTEPAESEQQVPLRRVLESLPIHEDTSEQTMLKADKTKDATCPEQEQEQVSLRLDKTKDTTSPDKTSLKDDKTKDTTMNERRESKAVQKPAKVLKRIVGWDNQEELELAVNLLERLLALDPKERITAEEALRHPFLAKTGNP